MTPPTNPVASGGADAPMTDVAAICASLSPKQRAAILALDGYQRAKDIPASPATLRSLWDYKRDYSTMEGCIAPPVMIVHREPAEYPLGYEWELTTLGLAVRSALMKNKAL